MIATNEAKQLINEVSSAFKRKTIKRKTDDCIAYVLAESVKASCFSPPFNQSAMDGYTLIYKNNESLKNCCLVGEAELRAGTKKEYSIKPNTVIRIFTGAKLPKGANLVIPQELLTIEEKTGLIMSLKNDFKALDNVRLKGSQFKKGELLLNKGEILSASKIALAASAGYAELKVYAFPKISIIVSGDELVAPGKKLKEGQVYESNSTMLNALLKTINMPAQKIYFVKDNEKAIYTTIKKAFETSDVLIISGGISVGKYDLVKQVLEKLKTKTIFHKIKQKPGKPLFFGKKENKYVFGLPGNPAASLTCFYEYVQPFLISITGNTKSIITIKKEILLNDYSKKAGLTYFLKARITPEGVLVLPDQESYKLTSFSDANCLVVVPEETEYLKKGDSVECHVL